MLQVTRNIPNEQQKGGEELSKRGILEMDLIEGKGRDLHANFGALDDWYWLSVVDVLTGYGLVATLHTKAAKTVAKSLREILDMMEYKLKAKVTKISADHGREFYTHVRKLLKQRHIKMKQVSRVKPSKNTTRTSSGTSTVYFGFVGAPSNRSRTRRVISRTTRKTNGPRRPQRKR